VDYFCVGTPITNEHYLNAHQGAIYGLDHPKERFLPYQASLLRPKTVIDGIIICKTTRRSMYINISFIGLYLVGQDVMTSGFVSSLTSGLIASSCILKTNLMKQLTKLHAQLKNNNDDASTKQD
jgi:all-trans-retinol 13,14-reductase